MKNIWKIYRSDLKRIAGNWVAILIVLVLCILPSLYAWFYLKSSRDPYGNTKGLKVAVVNNDTGTIFKEKWVNIGGDVVEELKKNENIWWVFVDEEIAQEGTRLGKYYASIVIETWFSEKMVSLLDQYPKHPEIHYTVNEKINAIAPKITDKGASTIKDNIQKSFVDTVNRVLMEKLNLIWFDLKNSKQSVYSLIDFVHDARQSLDQFDKKLTKVLELSYRGRYKLEEIYGKIPQVQNSLDDARETLGQTSLLAQKSLDFLQTTPQKLRGYKADLKQITSGIDSEFSRILNKIDQKNQAFSDDIDRINPKLMHLESQIGTHSSTLSQVRGIIASILPNAKLLGKLDAVIAKLNAADAKSRNLRWALSKTESEIQNSIDFWKSTQKSLQNLRSDLTNTLDEITEEYQNEIEPLLMEVLSDLVEKSDKASDKLEKRDKKLPEIQDNVWGGVDILNTEIEKIRAFQDKLPKLQSSFGTIDNQLQKFKNTGKIDEFIELATLNPGRFWNFVSEPVELVENKLFSIPNYGSAMSPFFTTLAIWVGSLLSISLLTTKVRGSEFEKCKSYEKYLGKWLLFLTIALVQGMVVSLWDMWLLDAYVADPRAFFAAALWIATVFSMVVYTTVSTFGNAGKALVIIFLVFQLSGAGGTFPIELSSRFFQTINPFLPFTYAIAAMREAVWGVVFQVYVPNLAILLGFFGVFLLIGIFIKPLMAQRVQNFELKFSKSGLGEH